MFFNAFALILPSYFVFDVVKNINDDVENIHDAVKNIFDDVANKMGCNVFGAMIVPFFQYSVMI